MLILPAPFGVADNNAYGPKIFAFLRLVPRAVPPRAYPRRLVRAARSAPLYRRRGRDDRRQRTIVVHLIRKYGLTIDDGLTARQLDLDHLITRMLDDLYRVMSYSRWKDDRFWPLFRDALLEQHSSLTEEGLGKAREFNFQRYYFQGIGRYEPEEAYERGLADLEVLAHLRSSDS
jgi:hypothetical protein